MSAALPLLGGCHFGALMLLAEGPRAKRPYHAETLVEELGPRSVRTIGCLDVGLVPFTRSGRDQVDLHIGNRCGYPEAIDLRAAVITGYSETGTPVDVAFHDPRHEIVLLHLGGAERGYERLALEQSPGNARRLCFDLSRIDPDARAAEPTPICFDLSGGSWSPT